MEDRDLTWTVIGAAMRVHGTLGPGFLESVYRNALAHELRCQQLQVDLEYSIQVRYDDQIVGTFSADLLVERRLIIALKAIRALAIAHEAKLVNYLTATDLRIGVLLNFGAPRLEFKRKHLRTTQPRPADA